MTARALRNIDQDGGIDNYILNLDEKSVSDSNYITKVRNLIACTLFHQGNLSVKDTKKMKYDKYVPTVDELNKIYENYKLEQQVPKQQKGYSAKIEKIRNNK